MEQKGGQFLFPPLGDILEWLSTLGDNWILVWVDELVCGYCYHDNTMVWRWFPRNFPGVVFSPSDRIVFLRLSPELVRLKTYTFGQEHSFIIATFPVQHKSSYRHLLTYRSSYIA